MRKRDMEKTPLLSQPPSSSPPSAPFKLYTRRWFMLFMFGMISMLQCAYWITYGTLADSTMEYYNVSGSTINLLSAFGPIAFLPFSFHSSWAIAALGLRKTVFIAALVCALGATIRCFAWSEGSFWLIYVGQFLNAASGPVAMTVPPALSAMWFGVDERTLATAVGATANSAGGPIAFCLGLLVTGKKSYYYLLYGEAILGIVITLLIFFFFDDKPPTPPCLTSQVKTEQQAHHHTHHTTEHQGKVYGTVAVKADGESMVSVGDTTVEEEGKIMPVSEYIFESWKVLKNIDCLNIILTIGILAGMASGWAAMLVIIVKSLGQSQQQAQIIGMVNGALGIAGGVFVGKLHDKFRHFKIILIVMLMVLGLSMGYFSLATSNGKDSFVPSQFWCILLAASIAGFSWGAASPLTYEALAELSYPVSETVGANLLNILNNILCLVYLIIGDHLPGSLANWMYCGGAFLGVLTLAFLRQKYLRSSIDLASVATVKTN